MPNLHIQVTDCNAFLLTGNKNDISTKIVRWALMLADYNYTIEHRQDIRIRRTDDLNRKPVCILIWNSFNSKIIQPQNADERIQAIKKILESQTRTISLKISFF